jgi:Kef-type K+ transport system membrane component KefB
MSADGFLANALVYLIAAVIAVPVFNRIGLGAVLGFLVAGLVIGPDGLAFVTESEDTLRVAELARLFEQDREVARDTNGAETQRIADA